jgi:dynein heavy chain
MVVMRKIVEEKTAELRVKKEALERINNKIRELEELFEAKLIEKEEL